jgi:outer membrane murein-binding lipoprotein Lpp
MQADSTTLAERNEAVKAVASLSTRYATLTARCEALEQEIAEAREACPVVRRQDFFDATLLTAVNETVRQLFQMQSRCEALAAERDSLRAAQQADRERFERDLKNFAAGYTQALDDAVTKGHP